MPIDVAPPVEPTLRLTRLVRRHSQTEVRFRQLTGSGAVQLLYGARFAIYHALKVRDMSPRQVVLVPTFHCPSIIDPILHAGFLVRFYRVKNDLSIDLADLATTLDEDVAAAIFVRYFGLPGNVDEAIALCQRKRVLSIDDAAHSFLAANPTRLAVSGADATIFSFKKLLPTLVGGGILLGPHWGQQLQIHVRRRSPSVSLLRRLASAASPQRGVPPLADYSSPVVLERLARAIPAVRMPACVSYRYEPCEVSSKMPATSRLILFRSALNEVVTTRRRNFMDYAKLLETSATLRPIQRQLPETSCPWGFPLLLTRRKCHDYRLRAMGVPLFTFGETLHSIADHVHYLSPFRFADAKELSNDLVVLAVHQDLTPDQIERYARLVNAYVARFHSDD